MSDQRGVSPVAGASKPSPLMSMKVGIPLIVVACAGVIGLSVWHNSNPPPPPVKEKLPTTLGSTVPYVAPVMVIPRPAAPPPLTPASFAPIHYEPTPTPPPAPATVAATQQPGFVRTATAAAPTPPARPKPNMISFADPPPLPQRTGQLPPGTPTASLPTSGVNYTTSQVEGVKAGLLGDQTFLLMPGLLACIMDTGINSTFEGPIQCHIEHDIRPHGVTLLSRGSIIEGWYHNHVQTGENRLFVQADWVRDPSTGCFIKFDTAPMADGIGQAGVPGSVDPHYLERFGAAVLLTLGQSGESLAQASLSKGGNTYLSFGGGGGGGSNGIDSIASAILRKQIDIPPTITVNQGSAIAVFITKVLDFSPCYDLALKDNK
jgi:type IV secretion system protein VirB10